MSRKPQDKQRSTAGRRTLGILSIFVTVLALLAGALAWGFAQFTRPGPLETDLVRIIPRGAGVEAIARWLAADRVIAHPLVFTVAVRLTGADRKIRAGEYRFPAGVSTEHVIRLLMSGRTVIRKVTAPEGATTADIVRMLEETDSLIGDIDEPPGEGTLLPDTYFYSYGDGRQWLLARMRRAMDETLAALWPVRDDGLPLRTPDEAVILASIVEKETARPTERPRIAAVFLNRLRKGMKLQADPTVAYGITLGQAPLDRPITQSHLRDNNPYNTYVNNGLPPGPIGNPGRDAIAAVLNPAASDELFFVADGTGGHAFAKTLKAHKQNVVRWRRIEKQRKNGTACAAVASNDQQTVASASPCPAATGSTDP